MFMTALALMPCAEAKTLYWTGQSSDGNSTTWLLGLPWSENPDAPIGDCEITQGEDDIVFSSRNVDNTEALTNYVKADDRWVPFAAHSVTFYSSVAFGFARIELTRDDLVAEGVGRKEDYDAFGKWTSARVTWAGGTVDPGGFDADECLSVSFSYTDMNGNLCRRSVEIGTADTVTNVLTQEMVECIAEGGRVTLFAGVDAAELGSNITFIGAQGVTLSKPQVYKLTYDEKSQTIYATPEPATATLSLLALAALAARRKRD